MADFIPRPYRPLTDAVQLLHFAVMMFVIGGLPARQTARLGDIRRRRQHKSPERYLRFANMPLARASAVQARTCCARVASFKSTRSVTDLCA